MSKEDYVRINPMVGKNFKDHREIILWNINKTKETLNLLGTYLGNITSFLQVNYSTDKEQEYGEIDLQIWNFINETENMIETLDKVPLILEEE